MGVLRVSSGNKSAALICYVTSTLTSCRGFWGPPTTIQLCTIHASFNACTYSGIIWLTVGCLVCPFMAEKWRFNTSAFKAGCVCTILYCDTLFDAWVCTQCVLWSVFLSSVYSYVCSGQQLWLSYYHIFHTIISQWSQSLKYSQDLDYADIRVAFWLTVW